MPAGPLPEHSAVRIVRLHQQDRQFDGSAGACRPPQVGDTGRIVLVYDLTDPATPYFVASVAQNGYTIRLADFTADELGPLDRHSPE